MISFKLPTTQTPPPTVGPLTGRAEKRFLLHYTGTKATATFAVPELADHIISFLSPAQILKAARISAQIRNIIVSSSLLQARIWPASPRSSSQLHHYRELQAVHIEGGVNPYIFKHPKRQQVQHQRAVTWHVLVPRSFNYSALRQIRQTAAGPSHLTIRESDAVLHLHFKVTRAKAHTAVSFPAWMKDQRLAYQPHVYMTSIFVRSEDKRQMLISLDLPCDITVGGLQDAINKAWRERQWN